MELVIVYVIYVFSKAPVIAIEVIFKEWNLQFLTILTCCFNGIASKHVKANRISLNFCKLLENLCNLVYSIFSVVFVSASILSLVFVSVIVCFSVCFDFTGYFHIVTV